MTCSSVTSVDHVAGGEGSHARLATCQGGMGRQHRRLRACEGGVMGWWATHSGPQTNLDPEGRQRQETHGRAKGTRLARRVLASAGFYSSHCNIGTPDYGCLSACA